MPLKLRNYQEETIEKARVSIRKGNRRIIIQASCGAGKTIIAASIVSKALEKNKKVIFLVHFRQLAYQAMERFIDFGIGDEVGFIMAGEETHFGRPIQIISIQTYARRLKLDDIEHNIWFKNADIVFYDECFIPGTLVDGVVIESLKVGDRVNSYNEITGKIEKKKIIKLFKSKPNTLCKVFLKNGNSLTCTETHPVYSDKKYLTASSLSCNSAVGCMAEYQTKEKRYENNGWQMRDMWEGRCLFWQKTVQDFFTSLSSWTGLLFRGMLGGKEKTALFGLQEISCSFSGSGGFRAYEKKQSDVRQIKYRKNEGNKESQRNFKCLPFGSWWKRATSSDPSTNDVTGVGVGDRTSGKYERYEYIKPLYKDSEVLQGGYWKSKIKNWYRNRRGFSCWKKEGTGQEKRQVLGTLGVENVEIYKQTSDGKFGGMCQGGYVYNIEVEDNNNYFANGILVHNCHSSIAKTRKAILNLYKDTAIIIGLTATPCRSDSRPLGEIYEDIICCSNINKLTELGYLVPAIYYGSNKTPDLKNIPIIAGDYNQKELGKRVDKKSLVGDILENWLRIAPERQTVIFATNVKHSIHIKSVFERHGINIEHIDAHSTDEERQDILRRFKNGDVQVVTNVGVFSEGADFPWASCVVLAKPSKSYARYIQMSGRGLRLYSGKENCILIDHSGLIQRHGFLDDEVYWSLDGKDKAWNKKATKKEKPPLVCDMCQTLFKGNVCPRCGYKIKNYGKKIEAIEADLQEITKEKSKKKIFTMEEKLKFMRMAEYHRREKGYAEGWASHLFRSKFSVWPNKFKGVSPLEPDYSFKNYLTYRNIQYHKSKNQAAA